MNKHVIVPSLDRAFILLLTVRIRVTLDSGFRHGMAQARLSTGSLSHLLQSLCAVILDSESGPE